MNLESEFRGLGTFRGAAVRLLLVWLLILGGSLWLAIDTTRDYLYNQLNGYAQDSANSLALALQPHIQEQDLLTADTMVTALVQQGNYAGIVLRDSRGKPLIEHRLDQVPPPVPRFFIALVEIQPPAAHAAIGSGWETVAEVSVRVHPALAYQQLWRLTLGIVGLGIAGIAAALALMWHWWNSVQRRFTRQLAIREEEIDRLRIRVLLAPQSVCAPETSRET